MSNELRMGTLSNFQDYLTKDGYSKNVIPVYLRKVKVFLEHPGALSVSSNQENLKQSILEYLEKIPLSIQKNIIHAALCTFYYFITGERVYRRLYSTDFVFDISIETEIDRYRRYLSEVARLSENTIVSHCSTIKNFLYSGFPEKDFLPEKITSNHVRLYLTDTLRHISNSSKKTMVSRIRSYVRFLELSNGMISEEILKLPMTSPVWKRANVAKYLTDSEMDRLFASFDQTSLTGIRNYAIACIFRDLGLRCSEVAKLSLDDFNWLKGTVTLKKTKSHSDRVLPLHASTGKAIETYLLHSRPRTHERVLFVRFKNKLGNPMGTTQVRYTIRIAALRAGLENFTGTHMLRHTVAKKMINNGIGLKTIADILGHDSVETTSIYTQLNFTQLQEVAGKWPEVKS